MSFYALKKPAQNKGFTLLELVLVITVLGIVGIGTSRFLLNATTAYVDLSERQALLREGSFFAERFARELNDAVPNSLRLSGNASVHCLQFVPQNWSTYYMDVPLVGDTPAVVNLLEMSNALQGISYVPNGSDRAIVFPLSANHVYGVVDSGNPTDIRSRPILSCTDDDNDCSTPNDADSVIQLSVSDGFFTDSPSRRIYIADTATSFCVRNSSVYRHQSAITTAQPLFTSGGALMAENISNTLSANPASSAGPDDPFRLFDSTLQRNAYVQGKFLFTRGDEQISVLKEVQIPNVP